MFKIDGGGAGAAPFQVIDGGGAGGASERIFGIDGGPAGFPRYSPPLSHDPGRILQGDPRLIMGPDGTYLQFVGGQPLMDGGLENLVLISLFTNEGWCGNGFMKVGIGSGFLAACDQPITRQALNEIRAAAEKALRSPALGNVTVKVTNPTGYQIKVHILIEPPARSPQELTLLKNGSNWQTQATGPAYPQIRPDRWRKRLTFEDNSGLEFEDGTALEF